jgi:hypothetical protein
MNKFVWFAIALLTAYTCFMGGRCFEAYRNAEDRKQVAWESTKQKMKYHGTMGAFTCKPGGMSLCFINKQGKKCKL